MKSVKLIRAGAITAAVLFGSLCVFTLFLPLPDKTAAFSDEMYTCAWEDGSATEENYYSAYSAFTEAGAFGIYLQRGGLHGTVTPTAGYGAAYETLAYGNLAELYALKPAVTRLERAALWRSFHDRVWYDGGYFIYDGTQVVPSGPTVKNEFVLLEGRVSASVLRRTEAKTLFVREAAELTARSLIGTEVERLEAEKPYSTSGGALYLETEGGTRLVTAVPALKSLTVEGNEFADRGALYACRGLEELTVPFVGNTIYSNATDYDGTFAWLFYFDGDYLVPSSLKRVKVTDGILNDFAFYRCSEVEKIDVCGLSAADISPTAFESCTGWKKIHCPNANIILEGEFVSYIADCGCTVFERTD